MMFDTIKVTAENLSEVLETGSASICWDWIGPFSSDGTPIFEDGTPVRLSLLGGSKPESAMLYPGLCDNRNCVNPQLYVHLMLQEGSPAERLIRRDRQRVIQPWDRERTLRFYYPIGSEELSFERDRDVISNLVAELFNEVLNRYDPDLCITREDILKLPGSNGLIRRQRGLQLPELTSTPFKYLALKRVFFVYWAELPEHMLLSGFHYVSSTCKTSTCHSPWHLKGTLRKPGTRNAKTEWIFRANTQ